MKQVISVLCATLLLAFAAPAVQAQPEKPAKATKAKAKAKAKTKAKARTKTKAKARTKTKASARARCNKGQKRVNGECVRDVDFLKGDTIDGDTPNGYGEHLTARGNSTFGGLIRLRTNFHAEILMSAAEL